MELRVKRRDAQAIGSIGAFSIAIILFSCLAIRVIYGWVTGNLNWEEIKRFPGFSEVVFVGAPVTALFIVCLVAEVIKLFRQRR